MDRYSLLITCEHAGNIIPEGYAYLFAYLFENQAEVLNSHRGWDPGAWLLAEFLGEHFGVEPIPFFNTRLLIEPNRSLDHPDLFSEFSNALDDQEKKKLIADFYTPYRELVETKIKKLAKPVLHISVHTFTPVFNGKERSVDIGLLFYPARTGEHSFCKNWYEKLSVVFPNWKTAFNEPYKGIDDGFTTYLRTRFSDDDYLGIELEWNQKWATEPDAHKYYDVFAESLSKVV